MNTWDEPDLPGAPTGNAIRCPQCGQGEYVSPAAREKYLVRRGRGFLVLAMLALLLLVCGIPGLFVLTAAFPRQLVGVAGLAILLVPVLLLTLPALVATLVVLPPTGVHGGYYCGYCEGYFLPEKRRLIPAGRVRVPLAEEHEE